MSEPWAEAVKGATETPESAEAAIRAELHHLWSDLDHEIRYAHNGRWSTACDSLTGRIVTLSRVTGATPWGCVPTSLVMSGTWQGILTAAGIPFPPPDMDEVRMYDELAKSGRLTPQDQ